MAARQTHHRSARNQGKNAKDSTFSAPKLLTKPTRLTLSNNAGKIQVPFFLLGEQAIVLHGQSNSEFAGLVDTGCEYDWRINHLLSASAGLCDVMTGDALIGLTNPLAAAPS